MSNFISRMFPKRPVAADAITQAESAAAAQRRTAFDGLANYISGMGTLADPAQHDRYLSETNMDRVTADAIFRSSWLGRRVVTTIADDMVRGWRTVMWDGSQDDDGIFDIAREEERLQVPKRVHSAIKWARHYGGAIVVMLIKGQTSREAMAEPLDVEQVKQGDLQNLVVFDRWRVYGTPPNVRDYSNTAPLVPHLNQTMDDPNFGLPEMYYLADTGSPIHHTRCIRFDGEELPWYEWARNAMWHDSVYKSLYRALKSYDSLMLGCSQIVRKASVEVFSAAGLADLLSSNEGTTKAQTRYQLLSQMMSMYGVVALDKDQETFDRKPATFAGLRDLADRFAVDVAGAADVPMTRLFGQSPGGLNATGESDLQNYDNHIAARQRSNLSPQMNALDQVLVRSALGRMPEDYRFEWKPLRQMSQKDKAEIDKLNADRDAVYIDREVVMPPVIARELRAAGTYPNLTQEDVDDVAEVGETITPITSEKDDEGKRLERTGGAASPASLVEGPTTLTLTPTMQGAIVTVNQALAQLQLPPWPDTDGDLTIAEFQAKHSGDIAAAANAEAGKTGRATSQEPPLRKTA